MRGQVVDTPTASELWEEISARVTPAEMAAIATRLERKSRLVAQLASGPLDAGALDRLLRTVFSTRRKAARIVEVSGPELAAAVPTLLDEAVPLDVRLEPFEDNDLPFEILHFARPDRWWLWTRWIWDPRTETGALPLVVEEGVDLTGVTRAETYAKVGRAMAFVAETGRAAGFTQEGPFGIDVFLACVYAIYMYTILRMRMTSEFNKVVPETAELVARLLGVHHGGYGGSASEASDPPSTTGLFDATRKDQT